MHDLQRTPTRIERQIAARPYGGTRRETIQLDQALFISREDVSLAIAAMLSKAVDDTPEVVISPAPGSNADPFFLRDKTFSHPQFSFGHFMMAGDYCRNKRIADAANEGNRFSDEKVFRERHPIITEANYYVQVDYNAYHNAIRTMDRIKDSIISDRKLDSQYFEDLIAYVMTLKFTC